MHVCFICWVLVNTFPLVLLNSWDREVIQLVQTLIPKETGRLTAAAHSWPQNESLINCYSCLSCPINKCTKEKHGGGYLICDGVFMFKMSDCYFNFYSLFKVLFIADAKISFDSFRNGMAATVNSKTIITVNPGKIFTET